jgi:glycosyltransferase involved in cell wall biosynthesis
MKLAIVNNDLGAGGAEKLIRDMTLFLDKSIQFDVIILNSKNAVYKEEIERAGIKVISIDSRFGIYNPLNVLKLIKILKNYDVVHGHVFPSQYWVGLVARLLPKRIKFITTEHNTINRRRGKILFKYIDSFVYNSYDEIVSITENVEYNLKTWLEKKNDNKFKIIENGIDLEKYSNAVASLREEFHLGKKDIVLTMVARFSEQKDHETLIRAMEKLPKNYKLLLLGEGDLKEKCIQLTKELNIENKVNFLGFRIDGPEILKMSDIGVLSSNFEGLSLSAIEVMASGLPFIASKVSGLEEMVDGVGVLYEHKNIDALVSEIFKLGKDLKYRKNIGKKCLEKSKQYCIQNMVKKYEQVYKI